MVSWFTRLHAARRKPQPRFGLAQKLGEEIAAMQNANTLQTRAK